MRNISPSALFALTLFFSCTAFSLQAATDDHTGAGKAQAKPVTFVAPSNAAPSKPITPSELTPEQLKSSLPQQTSPSNDGSATSPISSENLTPQPAQKPNPSTTTAKKIIANSESNGETIGQPSLPAPQTDALPPKIEKKKPAPAVAAKFDPFTGKITKNKVRIRLEPAFDGAVLREVNINDLVVVLGESEDFYAIQPPADVKAYVYRTFILDNVIEGKRVNARLKPDLEAPVVAQLNSGDRVDGVIHAANNKWMEIKLPPTARFYVAKEYISKAGDAGMKTRLEKKHEESLQMLNAAEGIAKAEMQKPFDQINIEGIKSTYERLTKDYPEFPDSAVKAKEALAALLEAYTAKKLAYLENQTRTSATAVEANKKLSAELQAQKSKVDQLEQEIEKNRQVASTSQLSDQNKPSQLPVNMSTWIPAEETLMAAWTKQTGKHSPREFYEEQKKEAFILKGIVDPYNRQVKSKPGDYMLLNSSSKLPIAFLYSTNINLQNYVGHEITALVVPRSNNNFAFPAYFVLQVE